MIGGLAIILGAFVAYVSLPTAVLFLVTMFTVHVPLRVQLNQATDRYGRGSAVRTAGLRMQSLIPCVSGDVGPGGSGPLAIEGFLKKRQRLSQSGSAK